MGRLAEKIKEGGMVEAAREIGGRTRNRGRIGEREGRGRAMYQCCPMFKVCRIILC